MENDSSWIIIIVLIIVGIIFLITSYYKRKTNFSIPGNTWHPGIQLGEVFLRNISVTTIKYDDGSMSASIYHPHSCELNFSEIPFKTKRLGDVAFTEFGSVIENEKPVFAEKAEWKKHQKNCSK